MPVTLSPLRYPGGKTQLAPYVKHLMDLNNTKKIYIEPFAGGFGVALKLLFDGEVEQVVMNDYDPSIYAIWNAILNCNKELIDLINSTPVTLKEWYKQKDLYETFKNDPNSMENAFATLFLNRTNVSGIINAGPIGGTSQHGKYKIDCRFNKKNLISKINNIYKYKDRITLYNLDANVFIKNELGKFPIDGTFIFYDPPYFKQGKNLYMSFINKEDHSTLSDNIINFSTQYKWIVTYDDEEYIHNLYKSHAKSFKYYLRYYANKKRIAKELLFANNNTYVESFDKVHLIQVAP